MPTLSQFIRFCQSDILTADVISQLRSSGLADTDIETFAAQSAFDMACAIGDLIHPLEPTAMSIAREIKRFVLADIQQSGIVQTSDLAQQISVDVRMPPNLSAMGRDELIRLIAKGDEYKASAWQQLCIERSFERLCRQYPDLKFAVLINGKLDVDRTVAEISRIIQGGLPRLGNRAIGESLGEFTTAFGVESQKEYLHPFLGTPVIGGVDQQGIDWINTIPRLQHEAMLYCVQHPEFAILPFYDYRSVQEAIAGQKEWVLRAIEVYQEQGERIDIFVKKSSRPEYPQKSKPSVGNVLLSSDDSSPIYAPSAWDLSWEQWNSLGGRKQFAIVNLLRDSHNVELKIAAIRQDLAIETDAARKFCYTKQIENFEAQVQAYEQQAYEKLLGHLHPTPRSATNQQNVYGGTGMQINSSGRIFTTEDYYGK